jgi:hypothetical protein
MEESLRHIKEMAERDRRRKEEEQQQQQQQQRDRLDRDWQFELSAQRELAATRCELEDLRGSIAKKGEAGGKIRDGLASGAASGIASGVIAAAASESSLCRLSKQWSADVHRLQLQSVQDCYALSANLQDLDDMEDRWLWVKQSQATQVTLLVFRCRNKANNDREALTSNSHSMPNT